MSVRHYAKIEGDPKKYSIPEVMYGEGQYITGEDGTFLIVGPPHQQAYGAKFAATDVFWPAEKATAPAELSRK